MAEEKKNTFKNAVSKGYSALDFLFGGMLPGGRDPFWKKKDGGVDESIASGSSGYYGGSSWGGYGHDSKVFGDNASGYEYGDTPFRWNNQEMIDANNEVMQLLAQEGRLHPKIAQYYGLETPDVDWQGNPWKEVSDSYSHGDPMVGYNYMINNYPREIGWDRRGMANPGEVSGMMGIPYTPRYRLDEYGVPKIEGYMGINMDKEGAGPFQYHTQPGDPMGYGETHLFAPDEVPAYVNDYFQAGNAMGYFGYGGSNRDWQKDNYGFSGYHLNENPLYQEQTELRRIDEIPPYRKSLENARSLEGIDFGTHYSIMDEGSWNWNAGVPIGEQDTYINDPNAPLTKWGRNAFYMGENQTPSQYTNSILQNIIDEGGAPWMTRYFDEGGY